MNRRGFLSFLGAAIAGAAVDQVIPLGRVWSFPKKIVLPGAPVLVGSTMNIRVPMRFAFGDIVSIKGFGGLYLVNHVGDDGVVGLDHAGLCATDRQQYHQGTATDNCLRKVAKWPVFPIAAVPLDNFRTPS